MTQPAARSQSKVGGKARRPAFRRWGVLGGLLVVLGLVAGEFYAKRVMGLGDPPLYVLDPQIEYMLAPSASYVRFGNTFRVNRWHTRSDDFEQRKAGSDELRVLVVGDSIVNGGARVDQGELATELLRGRLEKFYSRPVVVGNVSAGSWGPINALEYLKRFGTFEADVVVIVLNSEDIADVPGGEPIGVQWPRHRPALALLEIGERAMPGVFSALTGNGVVPAPAKTTTREQDEAECLRALGEIVALARAAKASPVIVRYLTREELIGSPKPGFDRFGAFAKGKNVPVLDTRTTFGGAIRAGATLLQDDGVHPNARGQEALAAVLQAAVEAALDEPKTSPKR